MRQNWDFMSVIVSIIYNDQPCGDLFLTKPPRELAIYSKNDVSLRNIGDFRLSLTIKAELVKLFRRVTGVNEGELQARIHYQPTAKTAKRNGKFTGLFTLKLDRDRSISATITQIN